MTNGSGLYNQIPKIKRAREYHVYGTDGKRYLDLFLDGGRALMGHRKGHAVLELKNSLERGLASSYPSVWDRRLLRAVSEFFPGIRTAVLVSSEVCMPDGTPVSALPLLRPFENANASKPESFRFLLPLPGSSCCTLVCSTVELPGFFHSAPVFMRSGAVRALYDLKAFGAGPGDGVWGRFDLPLWNRRGPWLYPAVSESVYAECFGKLLSEGVLISPFYDVPSCAPSCFTAGEVAPIIRLEVPLES